MIKTKCPFCGSEDVWLDTYEYNGDLSIYFTCNDCNKKYVECRRTILEEIYDEDGNLLKEVN